MDLNKILAELKKELHLIDQAIAHLEHLHVVPQSGSSRPQNRTHSPEKRQERVRGASSFISD